MGTSWEQIQRRKIQEIEDLRLDTQKSLEVKITKALNQGAPIEDTLKSFLKMKGRYLKALEVYGRFRLAPQELHEKRRSWLYCPLEETTDRVKTVSMFLNRLRRSGLAERKAEGRTYRYFITSSGRKRLNYYSRTRDALSRNFGNPIV